MARWRPAPALLAAMLAAAAAATAASSAPLGMQDVRRTKTLRVLAFGDSLTEGWIDSTEQKHPYTWRLESLLRDRLRSQGIDVQITNGGGRPRGRGCVRLSGVVDLQQSRQRSKPKSHRGTCQQSSGLSPTLSVHPLAAAALPCPAYSAPPTHRRRRQRRRAGPPE
jgi:hypothetical protein